MNNANANTSSCSIGDGDAFDLDFLDWDDHKPSDVAADADLSSLPILTAAEDLYFNGLPPLLPFEEPPFGSDVVDQQQQQSPDFNDATLLGFGDDNTHPFHDDMMEFSESSEASRVSASQNSGTEYQPFEAAAVPTAAAAVVSPYLPDAAAGGITLHCSDESNVSICKSKPGRASRHESSSRMKKQHELTVAAPSAGGGNAQRGPTERMMDISLNELSQYFHMPITQASKELKVGLTVLKKRCREFGIPRWPHRKLKSLESLIQNIQELSKNSGDRKNFMDAVRELEKQKKSMEESPGIELSERTKRLRQACFKQSYKQRRQALAQIDLDDK